MNALAPHSSVFLYRIWHSWSLFTFATFFFLHFKKTSLFWISSHIWFPHLSFTGWIILFLCLCVDISGEVSYGSLLLISPVLLGQLRTVSSCCSAKKVLMGLNHPMEQFTEVLCPIAFATSFEYIKWYTLDSNVTVFILSRRDEHYYCYHYYSGILYNSI